jgi:hypothetical protein
VPCWQGWTDEQRQVFWDEAVPTLREYCRVPLDELDALRPPGAAPLRELSPASPEHWPVDHVSVAPPSVTHSLQQQLRERTAWATELARVLERREATIAELMVAHDEQAIRARRFEARLTRLEGSLPVRLYRRMRSILPAWVGGYQVSK